MTLSLFITISTEWFKDQGFEGVTVRDSQNFWIRERERELNSETENHLLENSFLVGLSQHFLPAHF